MIPAPRALDTLSPPEGIARGPAGNNGAFSTLARKVRREVDANLFPFDDSRWRIGFDANGRALVMQETRPERTGDAEGEAATVGDPLTPEQFAARMGVPADAVARLLDAAWQSSLQWDW